MKLDRVAGMMVIESDYPQLWCYLPVHEATDKEIENVAKAFRSCGVDTNFEAIKALVTANS